MRWTVFVGVVALLTVTPALTQGKAWAQTTGQVTGIVTDAAGAPVSGVAVAVQGTARGAVSGADGRYTITAVGAPRPGSTGTWT